jgi:hypothetical protein
MTTGCEISRNHTMHIYKYNLNTQCNVILQINPRKVDKLYLFIVYKDKKTITSQRHSHYIYWVGGYDLQKHFPVSIYSTDHSSRETDSFPSCQKV